MERLEDTIQFGLGQSNFVLVGGADNLNVVTVQIKNLQINSSGLARITNLKAALVRKLKRERTGL